MFKRLRNDIRCILERDPAARSAWDVLTLYPGLHAVVLHRMAHWCWNHGLRWLAGAVARASRGLTGIEIHPAARIGNGVFFDHAMGVVVGETAEIGDGCTIYQGVTLGGTSLYKGTKRHPTLGRNVVVGAGAKVLGGFTVGDDARIGSNAVVTRPVPAGATAVGIPARIIPAAGEQAAQGGGAFAAYGVTQGDDPLSMAMRSLIDSASSQDRQITLIWQAIEKLSQQKDRQPSNCVPGDAARQSCFEAEKVSQLVGK
ncbi:serine O-acetyltransferase [Variovorax dokdonensis]|uniref:serine O-acetyltransferase n=1 Tax=Variovorax dokdonensis TaxID=344883 RepID=A0ABT7NET0_9BURK|nr:serine O-acetyltransferase [Variovorax dokdonensis]MDM0046459.1 serine O-acetyltransferase [Variovorax dokdonensis]